jgi:hypothetical protein
MKFSLARTVFLSVTTAALAVVPCSAQSHNLPSPPPQTAPQPDQQTQQPAGKVIFSRSTDESGESTTQVGPAAPQMVSAPTANDSERQAVTFIAFDMDVHLHTAEKQIGVRALITVRNDGKAPLTHIPLQISSSLNWERVRVSGHDVVFSVAPLTPGENLQLDVTYSGTIVQSAQRLLVIGTPNDVALRSDWDGISVPFTGLRGFGNVVWYPVSSVPVILGDGARLFDEIGEHKLHMAGAQFRLRLTVEFPHNQAPTVALINGHLAPLAVTNVDTVGQEVAGVATAALESSTLGYEAPSLFVATRTSHAAANSTLWTLPIDEPAVESWTAAAAMVTPFLQGWLGPRPRSQLVVLDLPDPEDTPFETGALLVTSIREAPPEQLQNILSHALTHAWMQSPRAWLSEGVAHFMGTLWVEKQRGRTHALEELEASRAALALAEPSSPGVSPGQPLALAISPIYYRTKATYAFWMLRDLAGDGALSAALRAYDPAADNSKGYLRDQGPGTFEKLLEQTSTRRNLSWFFADWVDADNGLPDLTIDKVFPSRAQAGNWLVAVSISNAGYASAEVPVTVRSDTNSVTQRVVVPAHGKAVLRLLVLGQPIEAQVNDGTVPETQASVHITHLDSSGDDASPSDQLIKRPQ